VSLQPVSSDGGGGGPLAPEDRIPAKRKKIAVPLVLAGLGLGVGLSHLYVRKRSWGIALLALAGLSFALLFSGQLVGIWLLVAVWITDLVGGIAGVFTYNRILDDAEAATRHRRPPKHLLN